jgi:hypothetical protein
MRLTLVMILSIVATRLLAAVIAHFAGVHP